MYDFCWLWWTPAEFIMSERAFACGVVTIHPAKQKRKPAGALFSWDARKIFIGSFYDDLV